MLSGEVANNTLVSVTFIHNFRIIFQFRQAGRSKDGGGGKAKTGILSENFSRFAILFTKKWIDFDNSASNSLIDFINIFRFFLLFFATNSNSTALYDGCFIFKENFLIHHKTASYNRVKFHTIILITSRYSSGMQQVAVLGIKSVLIKTSEGEKYKVKHSMSDENKMLCCLAKMLLIIFSDFVIKIFFIIYVMRVELLMCRLALNYPICSKALPLSLLRASLDDVC